jgi:hypothetical protein
MEARIAMTTGSPRIKGRDPSLKPTDKSALYAIAQAAIDVELFTIPLYMSTLYSIQGMHEINSQGTSYYKGRLWPGSAPTAEPRTANEKAFNIIFSVFIEEMLHLQLAADIANVIGYRPTFTSSALQSADNGWTCYGPNNTVIPRILDLTDTTTYANVKVNLAPLNREQIELLLAIEEPFDIAFERIRPDRRSKYFPDVPFKGWQPQYTEKNLPLFGGIGWMYRCFADYTDITYSDGSTLWDYVFNAQSLQRDLFNVTNASHPAKEYPGFQATVSGAAAQAHALVKDMMSAITDQGEGSLISQEAKKREPDLLRDTLARYAPSRPALEQDYPSYDASGNQKKLSDDAGARYQPGPIRGSELDHYERFQEIRDKLLKDVVTWDKWRPGVKDKWTAKDLCPGVDQASNKIPKPEATAQALNRLAADPKNHAMFSQVCVGSIKGITTVLNEYWQDSKVGFPNPSMWGSGDRVAICWAIFGKAPDLSHGITPPQPGVLQHSCQGLDFNKPGVNCAAVNVYHTCRGSNACKAEGGCGFVQPTSGGGLCGHRGATAALAPNLRLPTANTVYSAPGDNKCATFGGCAVPISASQLYPSAGEMELFNFPGSNRPLPVGKIPFAIGDSVYDIAWQAYAKVMQVRGQNPGNKPAPNDLRIAFPPST